LTVLLEHGTIGKVYELWLLTSTSRGIGNEFAGSDGKKNYKYGIQFIGNSGVVSIDVIVKIENIDFSTGMMER